MGTTLNGNGSFDQGIANLASYLGNGILPVVAALSLVAGIYAYSQRQNGMRFIVGAMASLLASGFIRLAEVFATQASGQDQYFHALLTMANWMGNVVMPIFAAFEIIRGVMAIGGFMDNFNIGDDWMRHFIIGVMCLSVSGMIRLLEFFVSNGALGVH